MPKFQKKLWVLWFLLSSLLTVFGQVRPLPDSIAAAIDTLEAQKHVYFLASDALEGRATGQRGAEIAREYIATRFRGYGLLPLSGKSFQQPFYYVKSQLASEQTLEFQFTNGKTRWKVRGDYLGDFVVQFERNYSQALQAPVAFVGFGITAPWANWDDFKGVNLKGKVALVLDGYPEIYDSEGKIIFGRSKGKAKNPLRKSEWAQAAGAKALIVVVTEGSFEERVARWKRAFTKPSYFIKEQVNTRIPIIFISRQFAKYLFQQTEYTPEKLRHLIAKKHKSIHFNVPNCLVNLQINFQNEVHQGYNVVAYKPGLDSLLRNEYIIITAHYDHLGVKDGEIYNGADDNASGTAGMLEIARAFGRYFPDNQRSIIFAAFGGEELNLLGSRYFTEHLPFPQKNIVACLNLDMIGRGEAGKENVLHIFGIRYSEDLQKLNEECNQWFGFDLNYRGQFFLTTRSDQWPFIAHGIPSLFYFAGDHPDYHTPRDDADKLNYHKLVRISRLAATVAYNMCINHINPKWHPRKRGR